MSCSVNSSSGAVQEGRMSSGNFTCSDSLLTECMPQLSSLFPTSVQYDCSVPTEIFSDQVASEATSHSADSIETIARSLSRNIHSSEVIDSRQVRQDTLNTLGLDESDSVFNSGIAADDMCSLLEQFEEASQNLDVFDFGFPKSASEPATRVTSPVVEQSTELHDLEVVKLLKNKNSLQTKNSFGHSQGLSVPQNFTNLVVTKSSKFQPVATRPTSCIPQISTSVAPNGDVRVSANYYREIQDHDYCSNVPNKVSVKPPLQLLSPEKEDQVNPEGSMLKSLLINSELIEKMKQETLERRTSSSSSKSAGDAPVTIKTEKVQVVQQLQFGKSSQAVLENEVGVDFEKLIDEDMSKVSSDSNENQNSDDGNSAKSKSKVSIVTVMKSPGPSVNSKKKSFTLDELIAKDMKRKAIEKAKLEAILQTAPRSNSNTPKTSPYQSPRKSDSPKLPELPELTLNNPLKKKSSSSRGSSKESSPKVSPTKQASMVGKDRKQTVVGSTKIMKEAKLTQQELRQNGAQSRQRTESKCLDVVDMEVDDSEIIHNIEVSPSDEVKRKQLDTAREIVSKASELVQAIVQNAPRPETDNTVTVASAADIATAENSQPNQAASSKEVEVMQESSNIDHGQIDGSNSALLTEEIEEELYETAMDIEVYPNNDDYFHDDEDSYPFEQTERKDCDIIADLNDNVSYGTDIASYGAPGKLPLIKDPLGLESSEVPEVSVPDTEQTHDNQDTETASNTTVKKSGRNYRKRDADVRNSPEREPTVFDKLPNYCRLLTVPNKYPQKGEVMAKLLDNSVPDRDRDPSPDRNDPMYNKVPSYVSHFANSTKYDEGYDRSTSRNSSRCHTPTNLVIAGSNSRPTSRPVSRESTPPKAYKTSRSSSSSSSCSTCSSNSSDGYSSRSRSRSKRRSPRRSNNRHGRRRTYRSRSTGHRRSRLCTRSRSRSPIDRRHRHGSSRSSSHSSSNYSRSPSRSRSRSRHRDRQHRGERRRERQRHSRRSESLDRQWREREVVKEKRKAKQIEERRIVYVGRISPKLSRRELQVQFEQFGDVEETSVHLRESGGDPYGFVTFYYTCDAFAAIENGNRCKGLEKYDLCFGGRRQFCKESYADLDGNAEEEEEMAPVMPKRGGDLDFDALLRQTQKLIKKKQSS